MKVLVAVRVPGTDVREVIQAHRRYLVELMQQWTRIKEDEAGFDLNLALVVDAELFRLDAVIRWLDSADGRLKRAAVDPPQPATDGAAEAAAQDGNAAMSGPDRGAPKTKRGTAMSVLELREVSKVYGQGAAEVQALRGVTCRSRRGRWWR